MSSFWNSSASTTMSEALRLFASSTAIEFFISGSDVKEGKYKPYSGDLPFGTAVSDTQELVDKKLREQDCAVQALRPDNLIIKTGDQYWTFFFDDSEQKLSNRSICPCL